MKNSFELISSNLLCVLDEIRTQPELAKTFPPDQLSYEESVEQMRAFIEDAGEFGIAYETMVMILADYPFRLSSPTAIRLLEVGLLMKFKTELPEDAVFDSRLI